MATINNNKSRLHRLLALGMLHFNAAVDTPAAGANSPGAAPAAAAPADGAAAPVIPDTTVASKGDGGTPGTTVLGGEPPAGDKSVAGADAGAAAATAAPETYADFTLPEGVEMDKGYLDALTPVFKEMGLSQEQAQRLIDHQAAQVKAGDEARVQAFDQMTQEWLTAARADTEIGGDKFEQNVANARLAVQKFGTPELNKLFTSQGIGNHPEIIRAFARMGALLREDKPGDGNPASQERDVLSIMYPNDVPKK